MRHFARNLSSYSRLGTPSSLGPGLKTLKTKFKLAVRMRVRPKINPNRDCGIVDVDIVGESDDGSGGADADWGG